MNKDILQHLQTRFNTKKKNFLILLDDTKQILQSSIKCINEQDFNYIFEDLTKDKLQFTFKQFLELYFILDHQSKKVFNRIQPPLGIFLFQSLITTNLNTQCNNSSNLSNSNNNLVLNRSKIINKQSINVKNNFNKVLQIDYQKKLINIGANGLINDKQQEKIGKYFYNHWVQTKNVDFLVFEKDKLIVQLIKAVWLFDFQKALDIANEIYKKYQSIENNEIDNQQEVTQEENKINLDQQIYQINQISSLIPGLQNLKQISQKLKKYPFLKISFQQRLKFDIQFKNQSNKKNSLISSQKTQFNSQFSSQANQSSLNQSIFYQTLQLYNFTIDWFQTIQQELLNPYYKFIVSFLSNKKDNKQKTEDQIQDFAKLQEIGIIQRFLYAKKFFNAQNFQYFKSQIKKKAQKMSNIQYVLLFGKQKESEIILQNHLDQFNDIQRVAQISVYFQTFNQQQSKITKTRDKKSLYSKFIEVYQWLLDKYDGGISRLIFDKKCLSIEVERKRKNLTKTYTFDCANCSSPQLYSVLQKKISKDAKQPKLKGYHYFAKDARKQIMHCIQCMQLLPRCSICLYPISVFNAYAQEMKKNMTQKKVKNKGQSISNSVVWCPQCKHGGHFNHIQNWFSQKQNKKCPVVNCKCKCKL